MKSPYAAALQALSLMAVAVYSVGFSAILAMVGSGKPVVIMPDAKMPYEAALLFAAGAYTFYLALDRIRGMVKPR